MGSQIRSTTKNTGEDLKGIENSGKENKERKVKCISSVQNQIETLLSSPYQLRQGELNEVLVRVTGAQDSRRILS